MRARTGGRDPANYRLQSIVWSDQGLFAAAGAAPYPGSGIRVVWDAKTGTPLMTLGQVYDALADRARVARFVAWAPDGRSIATLAGDSNENGRIDIWDATTARKTHSLAAGRINFRGASAIAWNPDSGGLAFAGETIQIWRLIFPWKALTLRAASKASSEVDQIFLAWSPDGRSLAVLECRHTTAREAALTVWEMATGKTRLTATRPYERTDLHKPLAWSPDGKRIAWGGPGASVWDVNGPREEFAIAGHGTTAIDVAWSPDGQRVLSRAEIHGGFTRDFELKVWDAANGQEVLMLRGPMAGWLVAPGFQALASPPGTGSDPGEVVLWSLGAR
jgi:WD40 repeat protein